MNTLSLTRPITPASPVLDRILAPIKPSAAANDLAAVNSSLLVRRRERQRRRDAR